MFGTFSVPTRSAQHRRQRCQRPVTRTRQTGSIPSTIEEPPVDGAGDCAIRLMRAYERENVMNAVLLTGAGFSHNWGGRLAREMNTAVALTLPSHNHLADLLHRNPNFEEALTELQNETAISARPGVADRLQRLEMAIVEAFAEQESRSRIIQFLQRSEICTTGISRIV
jgi:hypothetical protein